MPDSNSTNLREQNQFEIVSRRYSYRCVGFAPGHFLTPIRTLLANDTQGGPGDCRKSLRIDILFAVQANSERICLDAAKRNLHFAQLPGAPFQIAYRVVAVAGVLNSVQFIRTRLDG